jgi:hypothetical protein
VPVSPTLPIHESEQGATDLTYRVPINSATVMDALEAAHFVTGPKAPSLSSSLGVPIGRRDKAS